MQLNETIVAWLFLGASLIGAVFTLNAFIPVRRIPLLFVPSFFGSWLTAELAVHHLVWQSALALIFIYFGGPLELAWDARARQSHSSPGSAFWCCSTTAVRRASRSTMPLEGLDELNGAKPVPLSQLVLPFRFRRKGVEVTRDVLYREVAGRRLRMDIAMPKEPGKGRPAIMQIHGGAWIIGDKREQGWPLIGHLAANGWVCFNVNYRLSPGATWPEHLIDLKYALKWIRDRADEFGIDPNFVAVTGGSAGGHLTAMMALTANDPELPARFRGSRYDRTGRGARLRRIRLHQSPRDHAANRS